MSSTNLYLLKFSEVSKYMFIAQERVTLEAEQNWQRITLEAEQGNAGGGVINYLIQGFLHG